MRVMMGVMGLLTVLVMGIMGVMLGFAHGEGSSLGVVTDRRWGAVAYSPRGLSRSSARAAPTTTHEHRNESPLPALELAEAHTHPRTPLRHRRARWPIGEFR